MTRRRFLGTAWLTTAARAMGKGPLIAPVQVVMDAKAKLRPEQIDHFWSRIWPEAAVNFGWCGIRLRNTVKAGEVGRPPFREPVISGLDTGAINMVLTDQIPMQWDDGRALSGVTALYRGRHMCMIALNHAHGHQIPFVSVNTCVHELLHVFLQDIFESRPPGFRGQAREFRVDWRATMLWLFRDSAAIRQSAEVYLDRLRAAAH